MTDNTLDCSDLDQYLGKLIQSARMKEPLHNNDFRRWVQVDCKLANQVGTTKAEIELPKK